MNLASIMPGDIVRCNIRGRVFYALVENTGDGALGITANAPGAPALHRETYRTVCARDVEKHWAMRGRPRRKVTA